MTISISWLNKIFVTNFTCKKLVNLVNDIIELDLLSWIDLLSNKLQKHFSISWMISFLILLHYLNDLFSINFSSQKMIQITCTFGISKGSKEKRWTIFETYIMKSEKIRI